MNHECYRIGGIVLNAGTQEVTRDAETIPLPPLSFNLLYTLARHAPNVVTTRQLEDEVWSGLIVDRGTINKRVLLVRNALRKAGCSSDYIVVVRGTGYRIGVPVERLPDSAASHAAEPAQAEPVRDSWLSVRKGAVLAVPLALLVVVLVLVLRNDGNGPESNGAQAGGLAVSQRAPGATAAYAVASVAVLPFEDRDETASGQYLGDGIAREVIDLLSSISDLRVASASSSFALRGKDLPVNSIAMQLGVGTVLQGSVKQYDDDIDVQATLVDAKTGNTLWSGSYDHELKDVFSVQDQIASSVARALRVAIGENEQPNSRLNSSGSLEAFNLYLRGQSLLDDRIKLGAHGVEEALGYFTGAVELDPEFARAHVGVAAAHFLLQAYGEHPDVEEHLRRGEASARYALELDPGSSEALGVLGAIMMRRGEPAQAGALFERAIAAGNVSPDVMHWYAMLFTSMGYFDKLLPELQDAYRGDPLNQLLGCSLSMSLNLAGQPAESAKVLSNMTRFPKRDLTLALASLYLGDFDTARSMLRNLKLTGGPLPPRFADLVVDGFEHPLHFGNAETGIFNAVHQGELAPLVAFETLLMMGSPRAFDLEVDLSGTSFEFRLPDAAWDNWGVKLRRDPRFKSWIKALGYDQFWRKNGWPDRCRPTGKSDFECV